MTVTLRFRPVLFGPPPGHTAAVVFEAEDSRAIFLDVEVSWPLDVPLDAVAVDRLPPPYRVKDAGARVLPVQEITGMTRPEAFNRMLAAIEALATRTGTAPTRRTRSAPRTRRSA